MSEPDINMLKTVDDCFEWLRKYGSQHAKAKAASTYLEHFRKSKLALLKANRRTELEGRKKITESELDEYARSHPEYTQLLRDLEMAVFEEQRLFTVMVGIKMKFSQWQTLEASRRAEITGRM